LRLRPPIVTIPDGNVGSDLGDFPTRDFANDLLPFCRTNRCRLFRRFNVSVELRATARFAILAKRCWHHDGPHHRRGRRICIDGLALGIHDFWRPAAVHVIQEANAASTAHDRLALFEGEVARDLQNKLRDYFQARIDLYRMPHDYSLLKRTEYFSDKQEDKILRFKNELWNAAVGACPKSNFSPACGQALPVLANLFEVARLRLGAAEKHP